MRTIQLQLTILCAVLLAGPIVASKIYYTTWGMQANGFNSSLAYLDLATGNQGILFSQFSAVSLSAYNTKANLFHLYGFNGPNPFNITTIDGDGNLISSIPTVSDLQCLKYSASQNTLFGAIVSSASNKISIVTLDYTTGKVREKMSLPALDGDVIRSCDIDDVTGRLVLHRLTKHNPFKPAHLTIVDYQSSTVVGQYQVVFNSTQSPNTDVANVALSNSQLACIVGTTTHTTVAQLGKFNLNSGDGDVTPVLVSPTPVLTFVFSLVWDPSSAMFYTTATDPQDHHLQYYIDTYDRNGVRIGHTPVLNYRMMQARDLLVAL